MKKKWANFIVILLILFLCLAGFYYSQKKLPVQSKILSTQEKVDKYLKQEKFNGVVLVVKDNQIKVSKAYGYANYGQAIKNTTETAFPIASIQKTLTGGLIARAVAEGKLDYDQPIDHFYPTLAGADQITIRQLLNQTSGIEMDETDPETLLSDQASQLNYVLNQLEVTDQTDFYYTNANYSLLACILSQLYGEDYQALVDQQVVQPLKLKHTIFTTDLTDFSQIPSSYPLSASLKQTETGADSLPEAENLFSSLLGAGNLLMSAEDLWQVESQWLTSNELQSLVVSNNNYAGGYWLTEQEYLGLGSIGDYSANLLMTKDRKSGVILLSNQANQTDSSEMTEKIWALVEK